MDLAEHFGTIWRRKWRILLATIVVTGLVFAWRNSQPRVYGAQTLLRVTPASTSNSQIPNKDDAQFLAQTYGELVTTRPVVEDSLRLANLHLPVGTALSRVAADTNSRPGFIEISAKGKSPLEAERFTRAVAE